MSVRYTRAGMAGRYVVKWYGGRICVWRLSGVAPISRFGCLSTNRLYPYQWAVLYYNYGDD